VEKRRPTLIAAGSAAGHERDQQESQASRLAAEIDERVGAFLARPIEGDWPYLWIDATYVKVRE